MISWKKFLEKVIEGSKDKRYNFNQIAEMHIMTIANEMDMSYEYYLKYKMHAVEWRLLVMINKNKN